MKTTRNYNAIIHMAMLLAVCFVAYSCSSDDEENEPEYPVITNSTYYVDPDWDESIVYTPGLEFYSDEFLPGVKIVEKLVDYPAYVTYKTTIGRGMDICFVYNVDDKVKPDTATIYYDDQKPMAVIDWNYVNDIRRHRMTVQLDDYLKYNIKNPCKVYVTAIVTNAATFNFKNLDTYHSFISPNSDEYKIVNSAPGTIIPKSEWIKYPIERKAYLIDLKMRK